jgi:hypothetical protein
MGSEIQLTTISKLTNFAAFVIVAAHAAPVFAVPELKLSSGASSVDILDTSGTDSCPVADCVTYIGAVGSWQVNVTTGLEGELPFFELSSIDAIRTGGQKSPLTISFSDDGLTLPSSFIFDVGGTLSSTSSKPVITFEAWTDTVKFGQANEIGSILTFHTQAFSGTTKGSVGAGNSAATIGVVIDLGSLNARGAMSFDAALTSDIGGGAAGGPVPEPGSISMLGGALLMMGAALRRRTKRD